jgi:adenine-specific DNA-methyltransferase
MLTPHGRACFIAPRSFCSGVYFAAFRQDLIQDILPLAIHLFESRQDTFKDDAVLQENIIFTFQRRQVRSAHVPSTAHLNISTSKDATALGNTPSRQVPLSQFLGRRFGTLFFRLPTGELDEQIISMIDSWTGSLEQYGLNVSTGPVVPFRARPWLVDVESVRSGQAVPLLWMHNVKPQQVEWPVVNGHKPQGISLAKEAQPLLVCAANYVLMRRFSAKEEPRRLIAAPFLADQYHYQWVGLENHLNYIYKKEGSLDIEETLGLSALLNSALLDRYFRIVNGNTQVNATELRVLPLPPLDLIKQIGREVFTKSETGNLVDVEAIVFSALRSSNFLLPDFPLIRETRITMGKIQEAQEILKMLGLPLAQQNEISALTLLALAQLAEETPWAEAKRQTLRIHDILIEIKERYGREYAENTRETIRRQVIHQFEQAGLVVRNPDDPTLPTNSPRTHYALSDIAIRTIRAYYSDEWSQTVQAFIASRGALLELYQKSREQHKVPLLLASGDEYHLSPGPHNELQVAIVEEFGPRFAPRARLLYLGDTDNKTLILDRAGFEELGVPAPSHDKLPDVVLYDETHNWLFLIEAVTSHGPVSPKRYLELEEVFKKCPVGRVYVSAFPNFVTFKNFLTEIAWETEVWLAEIPDHMIHFNGDRFLGPRT